MRPRRLALAAALGAGLSGGCGGGVPILHPAHVQSPWRTSVSGGLSAQFVVGDPALESGSNAEASARFRKLSLAPEAAPYVAGRIGLPFDAEGGLTFTGRSLRVDLRKAFQNKKLALSLGAGGSFVFAKRPNQDDEPGSVTGGGLDVPILVGYRSTGDLYSLWTGPRGGFEMVTGAFDPSKGAADVPLLDASGTHGFVGWVAGIRAGFRYIHAALALEASYHFVKGELVPRGSDTRSEVTMHAFVLTPAAAVMVSF